MYTTVIDSTHASLRWLSLADLGHCSFVFRALLFHNAALNAISLICNAPELLTLQSSVPSCYASL